MRKMFALIAGVFLGFYQASFAQQSCVASTTLQSLPDRSFPIDLQLTPDGSKVVTVQRDSNRLAVFSAGSLTPLRDAPVGTMPVSLALSHDGSLAFTANFGSQSVSVVRIQDGVVLRTIPLTHPQPYRVQVTEDGQELVVSMQGEGFQSYFSRVSIATLNVITTFETTGHGITGIYFYDPNQPSGGRVGYHYTRWQLVGNRILIPDFTRYRGLEGAPDFGLIRVFELSGVHREDIVVPPYPAELKVTSDRSRAIVVHNDVFTRKASILDLTHNVLEREVNFGAAMPVNRTLALHADNERAFVSTTEGLRMIQLSNGQVSDLGGGRTEDLQFTPDYRWLIGSGRYGYIFDVESQRMLSIDFGRIFSTTVTTPRGPAAYMLLNQNSHADNGIGLLDFSSLLRDYDGDSQVNSFDFFLFLSDFFASRVDLDVDGVTSSSDFFRFVTSFFGCPE